VIFSSTLITNIIFKNYHLKSNKICVWKIVLLLFPNNINSKKIAVAFFSQTFNLSPQNINGIVIKLINSILLIFVNILTYSLHVQSDLDLIDLRLRIILERTSKWECRH
jgi:hypothetical protein